MSWKLRWSGWNKGMKRYKKKGGGYGYYDPNPDGTGSFILGVILLIVGLYLIPLEVMPFPLIFVSGGVLLIYEKIYKIYIELEKKEKSRKYIEKLENRLEITKEKIQEALDKQNKKKKRNKGKKNN